MGKTIGEFISEFSNLTQDKKFVDRPGDEFIELEGFIDEKSASKGDAIWGIIPDYFSESRNKYASYYTIIEVNGILKTCGLHIFWNTNDVIADVKYDYNSKKLTVRVPKRAYFHHFIKSESKQLSLVKSSFRDYKGLQTDGSQGVVFSPDSSSPPHPKNGIVEIG